MSGVEHLPPGVDTGQCGHIPPGQYSPTDISAACFRTFLLLLVCQCELPTDNVKQKRAREMSVGGNCPGGICPGGKCLAVVRVIIACYCMSAAVVIGCADIMAPEGVVVRRQDANEASVTCRLASDTHTQHSWNLSCKNDRWVVPGGLHLNSLLDNCSKLLPGTRNTIQYKHLYNICQLAEPETWAVTASTWQLLAGLTRKSSILAPIESAYATSY